MRPGPFNREETPVKLALIDNFEPVRIVPGGAIRLGPCLPDIMELPGRHRMTALIENWNRYKVAVEASVDQLPVESLAGVRLRAPIPRPGKLVCAQLSFCEGVAGAAITPHFFLKSPDSVIGPGDDVELSPVEADVFHHEAELALVIGKRAKSVSPADAMDHVFGYTCFLDLSARGIGPGTAFEDKSYDTFGPMGPCIATVDEVPDPLALTVRLWVDDSIRHDYPMSDLGNSIAEMIARASAISTLEPGDVLALGVNHQGLGPIQHGERVRVEIEPIGSFEVGVVDPRRRRWPKGIDAAAAAWVKGYVSKVPNLGPPRWAARLDR
jgi:2-keto-4-pentenoate hydratase/2-oxohepta-3-ene-1,7-dioic acid hydratase in catechol pathway